MLLSEEQHRSVFSEFLVPINAWIVLSPSDMCTPVGSLSSSPGTPAKLSSPERDDPLGGVPENGTLGGEGCAVAAAAMVFKFYGIDVDPQQLNWFLAATGGFTDQGWLYWDRAAWFAPDRVRHVYEDLPSYQLIDSNIAHGNPVIVRVRLGNGITHFVVIAGKDGFDYLVRDPGAGSTKGLYSLRELGSDIEALRFYQPIANTNSGVAVQR